MEIKKAIKLSSIGGLSGGLETLILYFLGRIVQTHSLTLDIIINGLTFTIVGAGIIISLIFAIPQLKEKKNKLLAGGIIGGFCAGLFFHWGSIFLFIGVMIFSASIAFVIKFSGMPQALRIFLGGILGGFGSFSLAGVFLISWFHVTPLYSALQEQLSFIGGIIYYAIIIYFMNFGMLIAVKKEGR